jgi:glycosyltransferase involved in cell wall biosynthesis
MRKIKVVHIITRFDQGGSAENTFLTIRGLDKDRYDVTLVRGLSLESNMSGSEQNVVEERIAELSRCGVKVVTVPELVRRVDPLCDAGAFLSIVGIIHRERPVIVHTHTSKAGLLGRLAAFFCRVPVIIHTPHGHVFWGYFTSWKTRCFIFLERVFALWTDRIITLTDQEKKDHLDVRIGRENQFSTIHSGVELEKYPGSKIDSSSTRTALGIPSDAPVVGTVGRLIPIKGSNFLIEAAAEVIKEKPQAVFVFLGEGELQGEMEERALQLGIRDHVKFLGWRPDVASILSTFDVFAFPSLNEGMGKALVEAMAMGKPVVASNVSGIRDLVVNGENGFLVPPAKSAVLAEKIVYLLKNSHVRRAFGTAGRKKAEGYSADSMVEEIDKLYSALLSAKLCCPILPVRGEIKTVIENRAGP